MKVLLLTKDVAEVAHHEGGLLEICKLGVHLTVVVPAGHWRGTSNEAEKLKPQGYELTIRDCPFTRIHSVRVRTHLYYYPKITRVISGEQWDLVHVDDHPYNLVAYQVARACRKSRRKVIFTLRKNIQRRYPPPFSFFESYVYRNAEGAIAGNTDAMDILRRKGFEKPVRIIQFGLDPIAFRRRHAEDLRRRFSSDEGFVIGYVGRFLPIKGLDTLIKALVMLPKRCTLVLVGAGSEGPKLKSLASSLGLTERIKWEPWCEYWEIIRFMSTFDVCVLPSITHQKCSEDFGRVLIEAMACGTPVVGSDSGEIPKVIGDAGLVFHEGDEKELAHHLRRLADDLPLRESLGQCGRQRVLEHFTHERIARQTVEFYRQIAFGSA